MCRVQCTPQPTPAPTPAPTPPCTHANRDRWAYGRSCCSHLVECSEPRPTTDAFYCASSHSKHNQQCWSTVQMCRVQCTPQPTPAPTPAPTTIVNCGGHTASVCSECATFSGWCNGDCVWSEEESACKPAPTDVALESAGASCVTSNSDDPWARGNDCARLIKGTDQWSADTGVHVAKLTGLNYGWLNITFAQPSAIHSVTVKQCSYEDPAYVSQNFEIESFDSVGEYKTLHAYAGSGVQRQETYILSSPTMPAAGVRLRITGETKPDSWWRLQAVEVMGAPSQ